MATRDPTNRKRAALFVRRTQPRSPRWPGRLDRPFPSEQIVCARALDKKGTWLEGTSIQSVDGDRHLGGTSACRWRTKLPYSSPLKLQAEGTKTVVWGSSTIAGPSIMLPL